MRTAYDILLSLTINHFYFSDRVFESFELIPDKKTNTLIHDLKLIPRKKSNNWNLFFQTEGPFATTHALLSNKEFLFTLKISDPSFFSITDETYLHEKDEMLFFNSPINSVIVPEKRKVCPFSFKYIFHHTVRPVNFKITSFTGTEILNETIIDANILSKEIDLTSKGENAYNISEDTVPSGSLENEKIFAREIVSTVPFYGTVYFKVLPIDVNPVANQYQINFETTN